MAGSFLQALDNEIANLKAELANDIRYQRLEEAIHLRSLYSEPQQQADTKQSAANEASQNRMGTKRVQSDRERIIEGAILYVRNRVGPVPTSDILEHLKQALGIEIGGDRPVNNLSATLSTSGKLVANGRRGWTLPENERDDNLLASMTDAEREQYEEDRAAAQEIEGDLELDHMRAQEAILDS